MKYKIVLTLRPKNIVTHNIVVKVPPGSKLDLIFQNFHTYHKRYISISNIKVILRNDLTTTGYIAHTEIKKRHEVYQRLYNEIVGKYYVPL